MSNTADIIEAARTVGLNAVLVGDGTPDEHYRVSVADMTALDDAFEARLLSRGKHPAQFVDCACGHNETEHHDGTGECYGRTSPWTAQTCPCMRFKQPEHAS